MRSAVIAHIAPAPVPAKIDIAEEHGWRLHRQGATKLWFKGYVHSDTPADLLRRLDAARDDEIEALLAALNGHFAVVLEGPGRTLAIVDRVRSIPIFIALGEDGIVVGDRALRLQSRLGAAAADGEAALLIGMSGYTMGEATLDRRIAQIEPGHFLLLRGGDATAHRYHAWQPWRVENGGTWVRRLADTTLDIHERMATSIGDRVIAVPLSAGLDSRLIVSALHRLGRRNVKCFSYGLPGNFEAEAGRRIAEKLGYPWIFVPLDPAIQRDTFVSAENRAYVDFADTLSSVPFQQDFHAVRALRDSGWLPKDAVLVNGQTGDFISGAHVPAALQKASAKTADERLEILLDALVAKHYSLWGALKTPENLAFVRRRLRDDIAAAGAKMTGPETDHALYEVSEFRNRQCKYVITGQRIYEFLGFEWRLPLWDNAYLDFWQTVPVSDKAGQALYRRMLESENWGGVWQGWNFPRRVAPRWLAPIRMAAKAVLAPFGRDRWHAVEKRYFAYPMDVLSNYAIAPYRRVAADQRGHRNAISWHAEAYLAKKGLALDGSALPA